jgi:hypothetical protein
MGFSLDAVAGIRPSGAIGNGCGLGPRCRRATTGIRRNHRAAAHLLHEHLHEPLDARLGGDVGAVAGRIGVVGGRLAARFIDDDGEAVRGEPLGDRLADAAGRARHDGRFPGGGWSWFQSLGVDERRHGDEFFLFRHCAQILYIYHLNSVSINN